jgi:hypothetical protein
MDVANSISNARQVSHAQTGSAPLRLRHALAGLEAGVLGAVLMCGWLFLAGSWVRRSVWSVPNLFATTFYGPDAYANGFFRWSLAGMGLIVVLYGGLGILWGMIWQERQPAFLRLAGAATGLGVYVLFFDYIWPHANPLVALYAPNRQLQLAHVLWGIVLANSPRFARNIASVTGVHGSAMDGAEEIRTGEVIL